MRVPIGSAAHHVPGRSPSACSGRSLRRPPPAPLGRRSGHCPGTAAQRCSAGRCARSGRLLVCSCAQGCPLRGAARPCAPCAHSRLFCSGPGAPAQPRPYNGPWPRCAGRWEPALCGPRPAPPGGGYAPGQQPAGLLGAAAPGLSKCAHAHRPACGRFGLAAKPARCPPWAGRIGAIFGRSKIAR